MPCNTRVTSTRDRQAHCGSSRISFVMCWRYAATTPRARSRQARSGITRAARIDRDADGEPLEVPFERCRQRLVEIDDVEDGRAVPRRVDAEIRQMAVAAGLHPDAAGRRGRQDPPPLPRRNHAGRRTAIASCARNGSAAATRSDVGWSRSASPRDRAGRQAAARWRAGRAAPSWRRARPASRRSAIGSKSSGRTFSSGMLFPRLYHDHTAMSRPAQAEFVV